jgi:hypothetical protein
VRWQIVSRYIRYDPRRWRFDGALTDYQMSVHPGLKPQVFVFVRLTVSHVGLAILRRRLAFPKRIMMPRFMRTKPATE